MQPHFSPYFVKFSSRQWHSRFLRALCDNFTFTEQNPMPSPMRTPHTRLFRFSRSVDPQPKSRDQRCFDFFCAFLHFRDNRMQIGLASGACGAWNNWTPLSRKLLGDNILLPQSLPATDIPSEKPSRCRVALQQQSTRSELERIIPLRCAHRSVSPNAADNHIWRKQLIG
jgi:hypothetical protein